MSAAPSASASLQWLRQHVQTHPEIVRHLGVLYPSRPPALEDSEREVWFKAGQAGLVEFLAHLAKP